MNKIGDKTITNIGGLFSQMVLATGLDNAQVLFGIAEASFEKSKSKFEPEPPVKSKDTFLVKDRRTGRQYELDLKDGTPSAADLALIRDTLPHATAAKVEEKTQFGELPNDSQTKILTHREDE